MENHVDEQVRGAVGGAQGFLKAVQYATTLLEQGLETVDEAKLTAALDYANAFQYAYMLY